MMNGREAPVTETLPAAEVQSRWEQVLGAVRAGKKRVLVEQEGAGGVAIVSVRDLTRLQQWDAQRAEDFSALDASWAAFRDEPIEDIDREVAKAVASARMKLREEARQHAAGS